MRRRFTSKRDININNYLTIEALEDKVSISFHDTNYVNTPEYCIDASGVWNRMFDNEDVIINTNQTLSLRGEMVDSGIGVGQFSIDGLCNLKGNCMSLIYKDNAADNLELVGVDFDSLFKNCDGIKEVSKNFLPATRLEIYCYQGMFYGCTSLTTAPELPATTLAFGCYRDMFSGCTSLTTAPELPAATADYCCERMFYGCTSLTTAPELPATRLARSCYSDMFNGCTNLNYIKMLATKFFDSDCLDYWVYGVASTGTFVKNKDATWNVTGDSGVPYGWTVITDDQEGDLITFYVDYSIYSSAIGVRSFYALEGMTWGDLVNSNSVINMHYEFIVVSGTGSTPYGVQLNGEYVSAGDKIIKDGFYTIYALGGGGGAD